MTESKSGQGGSGPHAATPSMAGPAIYRIIVEGSVSSTWANRLEGMNITEAETDRTILVGRLSDQSALAGVLSTLYELHLPVASVECLESG